MKTKSNATQTEQGPYAHDTLYTKDSKQEIHGFVI